MDYYSNRQNAGQCILRYPCPYTQQPVGVQWTWRLSSTCSSCGHQTDVCGQCLLNPLYLGDAAPCTYWRQFRNSDEKKYPYFCWHARSQLASS